MLRKRQPYIPKNPTIPADLEDAYGKQDVMLMFGMTKADPSKEFFKTVFQCDTFSYCVFASEKVITLMDCHLPKAERHFLVDATFKVCPFGAFKQLLIIYIKYMEKVYLYLMLVL